MKQSQQQQKPWNIVLANYSWIVVDILSDTLEKNDFPFAIGYQLQITSLPDLGPHVHFSQCCTLFVLNLGRLCVCWHSLWIHICIRPVSSWRHCLLEVIYHLWLLQSFWALFLIDPWALREGIWWISHLRLSVPKSLTLCTMDSCMSLCYSHQLQEAFLVWVEPGIIIWV